MMRRALTLVILALVAALAGPSTAAFGSSAYGYHAAAAATTHVPDSGATSTTSIPNRAFATATRDPPPSGSSGAARVVVRSFSATDGGLPAIAGGSQEQDLINSGENLVDQGGMTQAGRSIESHGGQGAFPTASGNAAAKNALGQQQLEEIVGNPDSQKVDVTSGNFAGGVRYIAPDGRGATFDSSGQFRYVGNYP